MYIIYIYISIRNTGDLSRKFGNASFLARQSNFRMQKSATISTYKSCDMAFFHNLNPGIFRSVPTSAELETEKFPQRLLRRRPDRTDRYWKYRK